MKKNLLAILCTLVFVLPLSLCLVSCEGFDWNSLLGGDDDLIKGGVYRISSEFLEDWDEGYVCYKQDDELSSPYVVGKNDTVNDVYIIHFNHLGEVKAEKGISFFLDSEKEIQTVFFDERCYSSIKDEDGVSYVGIDRNGKIVDSFSLGKASVSGFKVGSEATTRSVVEGFNAILDGSNVVDVINHFGQGEYGDMLTQVGLDALVSSLNLDPKSKLITTLMLEALNRLYFNAIKSDFYDGCVPHIVEVDDMITVRIDGVHNLRDWCTLEFTNLGTSKKVFLEVVVGGPGSNGYVNRSSFIYKTASVQIDNMSSIVEFPLPEGLNVGTYYLRPLLITDQVLDKGFDFVREWYTQYGEIYKYKYPDVVIDNVAQKKCEYFKDSKEYGVEVGIDVNISSLEGVSSWGVSVVYGNAYETILKVPSSSKTNYALKYQEFISEKFFDPDNKSLMLTITPFAVGHTSNDRVYCESKQFEVKMNSNACDDANHVHAVDLGLSVKWACCNVGAESPEGYGGYYAWGETEEKSNYYWETYKYWSDRDGDGYADKSEITNIGSNISGTSYDVAHVKWGGSWRMPTLDEIKELCNKCSWEWTSVNGVSGQKVTGPNGNSIFLPAAGYRYGTEVYYRGSCGYYWSGTQHEKHRFDAFNFRFYSGDHGWDYNNRDYGHTVRPVTD